MTIHGDVWQPGKTKAFDGAIALMIVVDHMTAFAAGEPLNALNSREFARAIYVIQLRYGLSHMLITDADSKFKGEFKGAAELLKIKHHEVSRGNHNAIMVERFNRFLNSSLTAFNSDRKTNRVFLEGAMMSIYAWNSAPVSGTDLSRSLLVLGREFHFPIDFTSRQHITFLVSPSAVKSYAEEMLGLLEKCQEVYKILIHEHRALHRELRNSQLRDPRKFKVGDRVFARVQVQSKKSKGQVKKLSYRTRGPYKVVKLHPSGSYDLQSMHSPNQVEIKKHGSDLYSCPQIIQPHTHVKSSDHLFGNFHKGISAHPYENASIQGFKPASPWAAPAAFADVTMEPFPTVEELDAEYDSWPESGNPFQHEEDSFSGGQNSQTPAMATGNIRVDGSDQAIALPLQMSSESTGSRSFAQLIADIVKSEDKLFFVAHKLPNQSRREWKLVQLDFGLSMKLHPSCLQDGKFIVNFYIEHVNDASVNLTEKRFWLEYHYASNVKTIGSRFHLIQPSAVSGKIARDRNLTPYREWVYLQQDEILIHGPFNFATVNNRKTRDQISAVDWNILIAGRSKYDCDPPRFTQPIVHITTSEQPHSEHTSQSVTERVQSFLFQLHFDDSTLKDYGFQLD